MANGPYFWFDDDNEILTIIMREMGNLNAHSPIYYMKRDWGNWLNLNHTLQRMYLGSLKRKQFNTTIEP